jgi:hypothetical protein
MVEFAAFRIVALAHALARSLTGRGLRAATPSITDIASVDEPRPRFGSGRRAGGPTRPPARPFGRASRPVSERVTGTPSFAKTPPPAPPPTLRPAPTMRDRFRQGARIVEFPETVFRIGQ